MLAAAFGLVTACANNPQTGGLSNQAIGTGVGAAAGGVIGGIIGRGNVAGIVIGAVLGGIAGNIFGRFLDQREQAKLDEATRQAFRAENNAPVSYMVQPEGPPQPSAQPTVVTARPIAPPAARTDGSTCRLMEQSATKNGKTQMEQATYCQPAGTDQLVKI